MDSKWILEERNFWDAMFWRPAVTADSRRGAKLVLEAKLKGRKPPKLLTSDEVSAKSWNAYNAWIRH